MGAGRRKEANGEEGDYLSDITQDPEVLGRISHSERGEANTCEGANQVTSKSSAYSPMQIYLR
jgi:hypothetical protein